MCARAEQYIQICHIEICKRVYISLTKKGLTLNNESFILFIFIQISRAYMIIMNRSGFGGGEEKLNWYHGKLSREYAEQMLLNNAHTDGTFLVRDSQTSSGDYVLSVRHAGEVLHYQIRRFSEDAFFSIDDQPPIHGLESLIERYQSGIAQGLATQLLDYIAGEQPPNESRKHGRTNLLHRATKEGDLRVVSELLNCGYRSFDAKNQDGQTAMHLACIAGNDRLVEKLIASGANVNCRDSEGNSPLHVSFPYKNSFKIQYLFFLFVRSTLVVVAPWMLFDCWCRTRQISKRAITARDVCPCMMPHVKAIWPA